MMANFATVAQLVLALVSLAVAQFPTTPACSSHYDCPAGHYCVVGGTGCALCQTCHSDSDSFDGRCPQDRCPGTPAGGAGMLDCAGMHDDTHPAGSAVGCTQNPGCCYNQQFDHCFECAAAQQGGGAGLCTHESCNRHPDGTMRTGWFCAKWGCDMCLQCEVDDDAYDEECPMQFCEGYGADSNVGTAAGIGSQVHGGATCPGVADNFPESHKWIIRNRSPIGDHWVIDELEFFSDEQCTQEISTPALVSDVVYSCCYDCMEDGLPQNVHPATMQCMSQCGGDQVCLSKCKTIARLSDDACTSGCGSGDESWAGCDTPAGQQVCGSYIGFAFHEPVTVKCVRLCQCEEDHQHVSSALLESWTGTRWNEVALLTFTEGVSVATVSPLSESSKQQCPLELDLEAPSDGENAASTGTNGEEFCEEQIGVDQQRCEASSECCHWDEGQCWSAIGADECPLATGCAQQADMVAQVCSEHNPCPPNHFCSYESEDFEAVPGESWHRAETARGHCMTCVAFNAPAGCATAEGLNTAGRADCRDMCSGAYLEGDRQLCTETNPCPDYSHFCNFDHGEGIGGYCETCRLRPGAEDWECDATQENGCADCGLPAAGVAHCQDHCVTHRIPGTQTNNIPAGGIGASCSVASQCPPNHFCDFSFATSGQCQLCASFGAPAGCASSGRLQAAGQADCRDMCVGPHTGTWVDRAGEVHNGNGRTLCSYPGNPCPDDMFCNFDHGETVGGFCEHCHDESDEGACNGYAANGCAECGLPAPGVTHCQEKCAAGRQTSGEAVVSLCGPGHPCPTDHFCTKEAGALSGQCVSCATFRTGGVFAAEHCQGCGLTAEGANECVQTCLNHQTNSGSYTGGGTGGYYPPPPPGPDYSEYSEGGEASAGSPGGSGGSSTNIVVGVVILLGLGVAYSKGWFQKRPVGPTGESIGAGGGGGGGGSGDGELGAAADKGDSIYG